MEPNAVFANYGACENAEAIAKQTFSTKKHVKERKMKIELIKHLSLSTKDESLRCSIELETTKNHSLLPTESFEQLSID